VNPGCKKLTAESREAAEICAEKSGSGTRLQNAVTIPPHVIDSGQFIKKGAQLCPVPLRLSIVSQAIAAHELIDLRSAIQNGAHVVGRRL